MQVNGLFTVGVDLAGEGAPMRVEPANPNGGAVSFGAVPQGSSCTRQAALVNRGRVPVTLAVGQAGQETLR